MTAEFFATMRNGKGEEGRGWSELRGWGDSFFFFSFFFDKGRELPIVRGLGWLVCANHALQHTAKSCLN